MGAKIVELKPLKPYDIGKLYKESTLYMCCQSEHRNLLCKQQTTGFSLEMLVEKVNFRCD